MASNGRKLVISISNNDSPETFTAISAAQEKSFTITNGEINITSDDDGARIARLGGGNQDISISVSGVFEDEVLLGLAAANTAKRMKIEYEDTGATITGTFEIGNYDGSGTSENGAIQYSAQIRPTLPNWAYVAGS